MEENCEHIYGHEEGVDEAWLVFDKGRKIDDDGVNIIFKYCPRCGMRLQPAEPESSGLIVLTEERLERLLISAFSCGVSLERGNSMETSYDTASRIMREVKEEGNG